MNEKVQNDIEESLASDTCTIESSAGQAYGTGNAKSRLGFAMAWTAISAGAWLMAVLGGDGSVEGSRLTAMAVGVCGIGLGLRWGVISKPCEPDFDSWRAPLLTLLLGYVATISWLGCIVLFSSNLLEALPACLVVLATEAWMLTRMDQDYRELLLLVLGAALTNWSLLDHLDGVRTRKARSTSTLRAERAAAAADELHSYTLTADANLQFSEAVRHTEDGFDETGRRYMSGEVHVTWARSQKSDEIVIGFCPAFEGDPEVEFEVDQEDVSGRLVNCTPAGIRIALRRPVAEDRLKLTLSWYAVQRWELVTGGDSSASVNQAEVGVPGAAKVLP